MLYFILNDTDVVLNIFTLYNVQVYYNQDLVFMKNVRRHFL